MKVLATDHFPPEFLAELSENGLTVDYLPNWTPEELRNRAAAADILLIKSKTAVDEALLLAAPRLKLIVRGGAGLDHVDQAAVARRGIELAATPLGNADAVGEQAVGSLLSLMNNLNRADRQMRRLQWIREPNRGYEILDKTVGVIGYGNTGQAFARKISGFAPRFVFAFDLFKTNYENEYARAVPALPFIMYAAEIVSVHIPLTPQNRHYINREWIANFRNPFWLLNLSRGGVMDTEAVIWGLETGKIRGAALDVFENEDFDQLSAREKSQMERLAALDNVLLTPHLGGVTHESAARIHRLMLEKVFDFFKKSVQL